MSPDPSTPCYHCGLPVPAGSNWSARIAGQRHPMCCPGCEAAAEAIDGMGLADYYRHRTAMPSAAREVSGTLAAELAVYDQPGLKESYVSDLPDGRQEVRLLIEDINCAACVWLLEKVLAGHEGVERADISLSSRQARIIWKTGATSLGELLALVNRTGYRARPWSLEAQQASHKREEKRMLIGLGIAGVGMMQVMMYAIGLYAGAFSGITDEMKDLLRWSSLAIASVVVVVAARPFFEAAVRQLRSRSLGMDVPVSLAIGGAWIASIVATVRGTGEVYFDSVCMFTFFLLAGRYLELRARQRSARYAPSSDSLLPTVAWRLVEGVAQPVATQSVQQGDLLLIKPGELIAADGRVESGRSHVDESLLTGESEALPRGPGDALCAGAMNIESPLQMRVTAAGPGTRAAAIERLLESAQAARPQVVQLADRIAGRFVAIVLLTAASVWLYWSIHDPANAFWITLSVLVVTCPCALSLATPAALTAATGTLRSRGFAISDGTTLESLAEATQVVFDKTGTLTAGQMNRVETRTCQQVAADDALQIAAALESHATHPIASALRSGVDPSQCPVASDVVQESGSGVAGTVEGNHYRIGKPEYVAAGWGGAPPALPDGDGAWILLGDAAGPVAWFRLQDRLRPDAVEAIAQLHTLGLRCAIFSGDQQTRVHEIASLLGIDDARGSLMPDEKLEYLQAMQSDSGGVIMVGDGINDAPSLGGAMVSVAMAEGADLTRARADAVLLSNRLTDLPMAVSQARHARKIIIQNLSWALLYNLCALPAAVAGLIPPWMAAIGMSLSSLLVTVNALRLAKLPRQPEPARTSRGEMLEPALETGTASP